MNLIRRRRLGGGGQRSLHLTAAASQYLSVPTNSNLTVGGTSWTWAGWVWFDTNSASESPLLARYGGAYLFDYTSGGLSVFFSGKSVQDVVVGALPTNKWIFFVGWYDLPGTTLRVATNDRAASATTSVSDSSDPGAVDLVIGSYSSLSFFLNGRLARVGYWKRVLTAGEQTELYNGGAGRPFAALSGGLRSGLSAWWDFNGDRRDLTSGGSNLLDHNGSTFINSVPP